MDIHLATKRCIHQIRQITKESGTMTRQEALHELHTIFGYGFYNERVDEALNMAIEALEYEQQRQEDIYKCQYCFGEVHKNYIYCPFCGERIEALDQVCGNDCEHCEWVTCPKMDHEPTAEYSSDVISRQAAIDAVGKAMPQLTTPDGCGEFDHEIQIADEAFSDCMKIINDLPSAQPDVPDTNVGDIISRQAVIEALHTRFRDGFDGDKWWNSTHVLAAIEGLSTAQPFTEEQIQTMQELESAQIEKAYELGKADRPTGHWIKNDNGTFSCSNCQSWIPEEQHHYARYCLYCGARMESEEE